VNRSKVRVIIPDSHGTHIDTAAAKACVRDIKKLSADEVVFLGDHVDCGGVFTTHARSYTHEMTESYEDDCAAANDFLDDIQHAAPKAVCHYIEGNHEARVERWVASTFSSQKDAKSLLSKYAPSAMLRLKDRGIKYYDRATHYMGLSIPGAIRLGKCFFVHGVSHSRHAAATHLARFGANVVFGHVHRSQSTVERTVTSDGFGAWCPGTLAKLQPLYRHTAPTSWTHGYGVQFIAPSGRFIHINVPIHKGVSMLVDFASRAA